MLNLNIGSQFTFDNLVRQHDTLVCCIRFWKIPHGARHTREIFPDMSISRGPRVTGFNQGVGQLFFILRKYLCMVGIVGKVVQTVGVFFDIKELPLRLFVHCEMKKPADVRIIPLGNKLPFLWSIRFDLGRIDA